MAALSGLGDRLVSAERAHAAGNQASGKKASGKKASSELDPIGTHPAQEHFPLDAIAWAKAPLSEAPSRDPSLSESRFRCAAKGCPYMVNSHPDYGSWCCSKCWYLDEVTGGKKGSKQTRHAQSECEKSGSTTDLLRHEVLCRPVVDSHWVEEGRQFLSGSKAYWK